jgi:lipopolysaccharide export system permease protein
MTVLVFTFVLLLGNVLKEILPLLMSGQVKFVTVAQAVGLLVPFVWAFALPMGMLTATLLIFGRFSADQELTAVRAGGVSLLSLISPILLLSLALCTVSAAVNMEFGPRCRVAYNALRFRLTVGFSSAHLPEGHLIKDFPGYIFYIGKNRKGELEDLVVFDLGRKAVVRAARGAVELDTAHKRLILTLYDGRFLPEGREAGSFQEYPIEIPFDLSNKGPDRPGLDDMTFQQLWDELHERVKLIGPARADKREWLRLRAMLITPVVFQLHRQVAFSFACFGFTLIGIPLGIRVHRRETNVGIFIALLLTAIYYSFILVGQGLDTRPECFPQLIVWVPNFLFQVLGAILLWRANRGV